ncbi:unnamed protein product [Periconia digitata]|uniref:Uncharacterized protein n=1 Tax=Periconia digitata TaxID=1303443 RepID=A0A9W4U9F0_9PLEO|nr:unnamed protein product [Periconia digitata]
MRYALSLSLLATANAVALPAVAPRAPPPGCKDLFENIVMVEFNDGPTTSGEAGIGAEFETLNILFTNNKCNLEDTFEAKRKTIKGRTGKNFLLSADTSVELGKGKVSAEYVLDGRNIRVGDGSAAAAGKAARDDLAGWKPWTENPKDQVIIENYPQCKDPWIVREFSERSKPDEFDWVPQVTASMPLEALYSLMKENVEDPPDADRNVLDGYIPVSRGQNTNLVTKDYFQSLGLKVDLENINDAVLGFATLVLSYAKAANKPINPNDPNTQEMSPKSWLPFMPRTEFYTIYKAVKSFFPVENELFDIFNTLACYKTTFKNNKFEVSIDETYCKGTVQEPELGTKFGGLQYKYIGKFGKQGVPKELKIKEWIENLHKGSPSPADSPDSSYVSDMLTNFDKNYDESIGGLGKRVERMYKLTRTAPLFEFRDLTPIKTKDFEKFMREVDESIQKLHSTFAERPMRKRAAAAACGYVPSSSISSTGNPTGTTRNSTVTSTSKTSSSSSVKLPSGTGVSNSATSTKTNGSTSGQPTPSPPKSSSSTKPSSTSTTSKTSSTTSKTTSTTSKPTTTSTKSSTKTTSTKTKTRRS